LSSNVKDVLQAPVLHFKSLESTNNRAAQMIDADTAQPGLTIVADVQTAGKGQRGNVWEAEPAQSLLMSIVLQPKVSVEAQFAFLAAVALAVAQAIQQLDETIVVRIKFPNDIIVNDKKAAGILIENSWRGNNWTHSIVGVGVNVLQRSFVDLPNATSLYLSTGKEYSCQDLLVSLRTNIVHFTSNFQQNEALERYNELLFGRNRLQAFALANQEFEAKIMGVNEDGQLVLLFRDGVIKAFSHGELQWIW